MKQAFRLNEGGAIDRSRAIEFQFDGRRLEGHPGDSLAAALLANGVRIIGRSFKFHRPRGIFTAGEEEPNALVEIGTGARREPWVRAPEQPLEEGLVAESQRGWPGLGFDLGRVFDVTHHLWPAGFYNKTFKWPNWNVWEGLVRRMTGPGRAPDGPDPDRYEHINVHCDLLVCGGGPSGLAAALEAGRSGLRVILAEQSRDFGGALNHEHIELDGIPGWDWATAVVTELEGLPGVIPLAGTKVAGIYDHNVATLLQKGHGNDWRECFWTVRAKRVVVAAGAIEQSLIFPDNDRPGIMLAGAVRHYLNRHAVVPGNAVVIATNNDSAYQTAFDLAAKGVRVNAVVDARQAVEPTLSRRIAEVGVELIGGARITATRGRRSIRQIRIADIEGSDLGTRECDLLAVSGGWAPRVHLLCHARGGLRFDEASQSFLPEETPEGISVVGSANGVHRLQDALQQTRRTLHMIIKGLGHTPADTRSPIVNADTIDPGRVLNLPPLDTHRRQWIDLAHDVTMHDAALAVREGYDSVEHFKRYTTTGMSVDQGKTGNINAFIALGALTGREPGAVGMTTFRPPYSPVTLGAMAGHVMGERYAPRRHLPAHTTHRSLGAVFEDYGWQRPDCYPQEGEGFGDAVHREVLAVRNAAGIFDNSPIGKIEVKGPDATEFLHRVYINDVHGLAVGHARYGLMLNENGVVIDDGVFVRSDEQQFLVYTTSAGVSRIAAIMEEWLQCEWTDLNVLIDDVTTQWANFTIAGPNARAVLEALGTDADISSGALPHMAAIRARVAGLNARITRVSYSGELSFEVNFAAGFACHFLEAALEAGRAFGIVPYGIEALMVLRAEKGYLHVGTDTDGATTPDDVGWGAVARRKESDYIGRRSLFRPANQAANRRQWVGLLALDERRVMHAGAHVVAGENQRPPAPSEGWITSACLSPTLGHPIALGMVEGGRQREGEVLTACDRHERYLVKVVPTAFYDPGNDRLRM